MSKYKSSIYNVKIKETNNRILVYNTKSGAVAWFERAYEDILFNNVCLENQEIEIEQIYDKGFIVDGFKDEYASLVFEMREATFSKKFETATYVITPSMQCNYHCEYCFEKDKKKSKLSDDDWSDLILYIERQLAKNNHLKTVYVSWFGGEPLLCVDDIIKYSLLLKKRIESFGVKYTSRMITNGSLLSKENIVAIKESGINKIQITLDGLSTTYARKKNLSAEAFKVVIDNIKTVYKYIDILIRINIDKENYAEIEQLVNYLMIDCDLKNQIQLVFALIEPWNDETYENQCIDDKDYLNIIKKIHIQALKYGYEKSIVQKRPVRRRLSCGLMQVNSCVIGPGGKLYKCSHCLGTDAYIIGDVKHGLYHNDYEMLFLNRELLPKCKTCKAFPLCMGGCPANQIIHNCREPICEGYIDLIKEEIDFAIRCKKKPE